MVKQKGFIPFLVSVLLAGNSNIVAQNWAIGGNNVNVHSAIGTNTNYALVFETSNVEAGRVTATGNWGLGTILPTAKLDVRSIAGKRPLQAAIGSLFKFVVHTTGGVSIGSSALAPINGLYVAGNVGIGTNMPEHTLHVAGNEILSTGIYSGFKFRERGSKYSADDWVWYAAERVTRLWRAGVGDLLTINTKGHLALGVPTAAGYKLKVSHDVNAFGLDLEHQGSGNDWELYASSTTDLVLRMNGTWKGSFKGSSGVYMVASDEKLKTNIRKMPDVLDKLQKLNASLYQFKDQAERKDTATHLGFLAQDVLKVFPQLVSRQLDQERGLDSYGLDYSGFGVIAIKGIQELQKKNLELQQIIQSLEERLQRLESTAEISGKRSAEMKGVSLEQNFPNPFNSATVIKFNVPDGANAQLVIYDMATGNHVRTIAAPADGKLSINALEFNPGIYTYSLVVDGQFISSRKMIVTR
jgi:hypothetical protein